MKNLLLLGLGVTTMAFGAFFLNYDNLVAQTATNVTTEQTTSIHKPKKTMKAFGSDAEMKAYFAIAAERQRSVAKATGSMSNASASAAPSVVADAAAPAEESKQVVSKDEESVTNTQHAGVDEGGIVKVHGDHLVILRRGRLFTIRVGDNTLRSESSINAYAPGINPRNDWYDEMLISGDTIVVIGYSYARGGTEINLFDINAAGKLKYRSTHNMRSNDYYSSRNYASRLIGDKLIFYTPQYLYGSDPTKQFPAIRKWRKGVTESDFQPIVQSTDIYRANRDAVANGVEALHTVTVCDLGRGEFACKATGVIGAAGRVFYVSPKSVYVWTTAWSYGRNDATKTTSMLYKMPLDGSAPSALGVNGSPIDQFSFLESEDENINILVRADGRGDEMWGAESSSGATSLLRIPTGTFSDGSETTPYYRYRKLPNPNGYSVQNRFVGSYLIYGTGNDWGAPKDTTSENLFAVNWTNGDVSKLRISHSVDRIEQLGNDAIIVGTNGNDLFFSPLQLGRAPELKSAYARKNASQGELRSHGFFYKPDSENSGLLGLPIARQGRRGYKHLVEGSAAILFLRNNSLQFDELGEMEAKNTSENDGCRASCVDWYGNARPLFLKNRVFALLGYEIVEGDFTGTRIREARRINYSPSIARPAFSEE